MPTNTSAHRFGTGWLQIAIAASVVAIATLLVPWLVYEPDLTETDVDLLLLGGGQSVDSKQRPADVVFVGNSLIEQGIDLFEFSRETGRTAKSLWTERSAGGWWYLVFERVIARRGAARGLGDSGAVSPGAPRHPSLVVICFIDDWLTRASLAHGQEAVERALALLGHESRVGEAAGEAVESAHSDAFLFLDRHWPLVAVRGQVRDSVEQTVKGWVARLVDRSPAAIDGDMAHVFTLGAKDAELLDQHATQQSLNAPVYDFGRVVEHSFLPELLAIADASDIPTVFLHMPRKDAPWRRENAELEVARQRYLADLDRYLTRRGFALVDLSKVEGLSLEYFAAGDHLTPAGRALFMPVLEAALEPYLPPAELARR
jgi:hypothetical protein